MIEHLKARKPIRVILDGMDMGIYTFNEEKQRYIGFGYLTLDAIKRILKREIEFIKIERVDNK